MYNEKFLVVTSNLMSQQILKKYCCDVSTMANESLCSQQCPNESLGLHWDTFCSVDVPNGRQREWRCPCELFAL